MSKAEQYIQAILKQFCKTIYSSKFWIFFIFENRKQLHTKIRSIKTHFLHFHERRLPRSTTAKTDAALLLKTTAFRVVRVVQIAQIAQTAAV
jgi:hypothetical protein